MIKRLLLRRLTFLSLGSLVGFPTLVFAGWGIFDGLGAGIGKATQAVSDAVWRTALIAAVKESLPLIFSYLLLFLCIVGAIVTLILVKYMADDFMEVIKAEMASPTKSLFDKIAVVFYGLIVSPSILVMLAFGLFLAYASYQGIDGLINLKVPHR